MRKKKKKMKLIASIRARKVVNKMMNQLRKLD